MKTKKIYTGDIKRYNIKKLGIDKNAEKILEANQAIVKKDALFYYNKLGILISFDYRTRLPDFNEAEELSIYEAKNSFTHSADPGFIYCDEKSIKYDKSISTAEFKVLKKTYEKK